MDFSKKRVTLFRKKTNFAGIYRFLTKIPFKMKGIADSFHVGVSAYTSPRFKIIEFDPEGIFCISSMDGSFGHEGVGGDNDPIFGNQY